MANLGQLTITLVQHIFFARPRMAKHGEAGVRCRRRFAGMAQWPRAELQRFGTKTRDHRKAPARHFETLGDDGAATT